MRLRQIALVAKDLEPVAAQLHAVFGLNVAFRDPAVATFGLVNVVMPVGGEFLEILQPVTVDASAGRYLARRGGDAGYMLIFEAPDALAHRERLVAKGLRSIAQWDKPHYTFTHFHPKDFDGVLVSIDTAGDGSSWRERFGDWPPAGRNWRNCLAPADIKGIVGATVQSRDPEAAAARWSELLQTERDGTALKCDGATVRFVDPVDADGSGIVGVDIAVSDPAPIIAHAETNGCLLSTASFKSAACRSRQ
ncbi:MAG: VOC family protein [Rhizomicrobium sp.]